MYICLNTAFTLSPHILGASRISAGREPTCNAGDTSSIPGSGRSPGEGTGYWLQYSWASLLAQTVKNRSAMQETWVRPLGWEDPLEKGMANHSSILAWRIPWTEKPGSQQSMGLERVRHDWMTFTFFHIFWYIFTFTQFVYYLFEISQNSWCMDYLEMCSFPFA